MAESPGAIIAPDDLRTIAFDVSRWRSGYDMREVDDFLDRAAAELDLPVERRTLTAAQVGTVRFRTGRPGYAMKPVDDFLDLIAGQLTIDENLRVS